MAKKAELHQTNFSQGEVSEEIEARPDVGKRFNGARTLENVWALPEGGCFRRPGTQFICEVKDSSKFTRGIPFKYSVTESYGIEVGEGYFRFIKNHMQVLNGGLPVEVLGSPYLEADLRDLHYEQSSDFVFLCSTNPAYDIQKLARLTDTQWELANFAADPPPSFPADENLGVPGAISANIGTGIKFRVGSDQFIESDVDRQIVAGIGRATITAVDDARQLTVDVLDNFSESIVTGPNTLSSTGATVTSTGHGAVIGNAVVLTSGAQAGEIRMITGITDPDTFTIDAAFSVNQAGVTWNRLGGFASGAWALRLSPQTNMDVNKRGPAGAQITLTCAKDTWRSTYIGKFVVVGGGVVKVTLINTLKVAKGKIILKLVNLTGPPPITVLAGDWSLEEASWSATRGRPRTVSVHQGRLVFAATPTQPKTFWGANLNDIYNFALGVLATDAYQYTFQDGAQNPIEWLVSLVGLYIGDAEREHAAKGQGIDAPLGGDEVPFVAKISESGSKHVQPVIIDNTILTIQRFGRDVVQLAYSLQDSPDAQSLVPNDPTLFVRQIRDMRFAQHQPAYHQKPNSILFFPLENGQLAGLTIKPRQEILAWARTVTDGEIESAIVVPHENQLRSCLLVIVKRTINGQTKRYWEFFEDQSETVGERGWSQLQTDCAKVGVILANNDTITGLGHLEGKTVDVIIGDEAIEQKVVNAGQITLAPEEIPETDTVYEVGLPYTSTVATLRPAIPNEVTEGFKRFWPFVTVRLKNTIGGKLNGLPLKPTGGDRLFTGLAMMENVNTTDPYDGALTITQDQPYPMTILGVAGKCQFADEMG